LVSLLPIAQAAKQETHPATLKQDFFALFVKLSDWQRSLTSMNLKALPLDDPWLNRLIPERSMLDQWHTLIADLT